MEQLPKQILETWNKLNQDFTVCKTNYSPEIFAEVLRDIESFHEGMKNFKP